MNGLLALAEVGEGMEGGPLALIIVSLVGALVYCLKKVTEFQTAKRNGKSAAEEKGARTLIIEAKEAEARTQTLEILKKLADRIDTFCDQVDDLHEWFGPTGKYKKLHEEIKDDPK